MTQAGTYYSISIILNLVEPGLGISQDEVPTSQLEQLGNVSLDRIRRVDPGISSPTTLAQVNYDRSEYHRLMSLWEGISSQIF
jgi:hypothetical protein